MSRKTKGYRCGFEKAYWECCKKCDFQDECRVAIELYWIIEMGKSKEKKVHRR